MATAYIGLGTNLGDREENLSRAISLIESTPGITVIRKSTVLETAPVEYLDQPDFLNQAIAIETEIPPDELLDALLAIEKSMGRKRDIPKGPRTIDLDILLYGRIVMSTERLRIPHPAITRRKFLMVHLVELDPGLADPESARAYKDILAEQGKA